MNGIQEVRGSIPLGSMPRSAQISRCGSTLNRAGRFPPTCVEGQYAGIAQLVEHNLAKVGVAGSSPVSRSAGQDEEHRIAGAPIALPFCVGWARRVCCVVARSALGLRLDPDGEIGRREGLKIPYPRGCAGSSPAPGMREGRECRPSRPRRARRCRASPADRVACTGFPST